MTAVSVHVRAGPLIWMVRLSHPAVAKAGTVFGFLPGSARDFCPARTVNNMQSTWRCRARSQRVRTHPHASAPTNTASSPSEKQRHGRRMSSLLYHVIRKPPGGLQVCQPKNSRKTAIRRSATRVVLLLPMPPPTRVSRHHIRPRTCAAAAALHPRIQSAHLSARRRQ